LNGIGSKATSTVIAEEGAFITVIEGFFVDILFDYFPGLCSRFYFYLATEMYKRLKNKYKVMNAAIPTLQKGPSQETNFDLMSIISKDILQETPRPAKLTSKLGDQRMVPAKVSKLETQGKSKVGTHKTAAASSAKFGSMREKKREKEKSERVILLTADTKSKVGSKRDERKDEKKEEKNPEEVSNGGTLNTLQVIEIEKRK